MQVCATSCPPSSSSPSSSSSSLHRTQALQQPERDSNDFEILVSEPVKQGEGVGAYVSYKVVTHTDLPQYRSKHSEVIRRFRDFAWLHGRLAELNKGMVCVYLFVFDMLWLLYGAYVSCNCMSICIPPLMFFFFAVHIHTYMYTHIHTHVYTHTCVYTHTHVYTTTHIHPHYYTHRCHYPTTAREECCAKIPNDNRVYRTTEGRPHPVYQQSGMYMVLLNMLLFCCVLAFYYYLLCVCTKCLHTECCC